MLLCITCPLALLLLLLLLPQGCAPGGIHAGRLVQVAPDWHALSQSGAMHERPPSEHRREWRMRDDSCGGARLPGLTERSAALSTRLSPSRGSLSLPLSASLFCLFCLCCLFSASASPPLCGGQPLLVSVLGVDQGAMEVVRGRVNAKQVDKTKRRRRKAAKRSGKRPSLPERCPRDLPTRSLQQLAINTDPCPICPFCSRSSAVNTPSCYTSCDGELAVAVSLFFPFLFRNPQFVIGNCHGQPKQ